MKNKFYIILLCILIAITLLSFAAICNSGQLKSEGETDDQSEEEKKL